MWIIKTAVFCLVKKKIEERHVSGNIIVSHTHEMPLHIENSTSKYFFKIVWTIKLMASNSTQSRSQSPSRLRRGSAADHLLRLRVRNPPGHGCLSLSLSYERYALARRGLCVELITRPGKFYQGLNGLGFFLSLSFKVRRKTEPVSQMLH